MDDNKYFQRLKLAHNLFCDRGFIYPSHLDCFKCPYYYQETIGIYQGTKVEADVLPKCIKNDIKNWALFQFDKEQ